MLVEEVRSKKEQTYGLTAEQLVNKIEQDGSCVMIMEHLLTPMNERELSRFLMSAAPERYLMYHSTMLDDETVALLERIKLAFHSAYRRASADLQRELARKFVTMLREESEGVLLPYEAAFVRGYDLDHLPPADRSMVKAHVLGRLRSESDRALWRCLENIGQHLEPKEAEGLVDVAMRTLPTIQKGEIPKELQEAFWDIYGKAHPPVKEAMNRRAEIWIRHHKGQNREELARLAEALRGSWDVPF